MGYKGRGRPSTYLSIRFVGWIASIFMICGLFIIWKGDQSWLQNAPILQFCNSKEKNLNVSMAVEESHHGKNVNVSIVVEEGHGKNVTVSMVVDGNHQEKNVNVSMAVEEGHGKNVDVSMVGEESRQGKNVKVFMAVEEGHEKNMDASKVGEDGQQGKNVNVSIVGEGNKQEKNVNVSISEEEGHKKNVDVFMVVEESRFEKNVNVSMMEKNVNNSMSEEESHQEKNVNVSMAGEESHHEKNVDVSMVLEKVQEGKNKNVFMVVEEGHHGKNANVSMAGEENHHEKNVDVSMVVEKVQEGKNKNVSMVVEEGHHGKNVNVSMAEEEDHQGENNDSTSHNKNGPCNLFRGKWMYDESYVLYVDGPCPFASVDVNCRKNGRVDSSYERWRWQPHNCDLPRFDALQMLEALRGKRLVYVGDSINRNQWQSMLCLLRAAVPYDESNMHTKDDGYFLQYFVKGYNCSIEFSWAPFLVQQNWNTGRETLRIDLISQQSQHWTDADILIFNSWHWWTHPEPRKGVNYFAEGGQVIPYMEEHAAFEKAMWTWTKWISTHINPDKTQVYFRCYSPLHFHGKGWGKNVGGGCFNETEPIDKMEGEAKRGHGERKKMEIVEKVVEESKKTVEVKLLNITEMSMYRKDAHPSVYTSKYANMTNKNDYGHADCSHWCLPGLPDVWNNILYAFLA